MKKNNSKKKILVRVDKDWTYPDLFRQTPKSSSNWGNVEFTTDPVKDCDFLVVFNRPNKRINVNCPKGNKWLFIQEPPVDTYQWLKKSYKYFDRVYTFGEKLVDQQISLQTALPWHVNKSYDELTALTQDHIGKKQDRISWVTSNSLTKPGHALRMSFKDFLISEDVDFDLFGRGFTPIEDKFDGIYPYKYSIAIENHATNDYWTEKISDCFLSWTMPIYYGCKNILEYFPAESMIMIDPNKPQEAKEKIDYAIKNNLWKKNIKYIAQARDLVLNKYQFFPWVSSLITDKIEKEGIGISIKSQIPANPSPSERNIGFMIKSLLHI